MPENDRPPRDDLPTAVVRSARGHRLPLVWLVPLIAVIVGGWLAVRTILEQGPTISISFRTAEGLEAGKTKIKLKEVEIGTVQSIALAEDPGGVVITAELAKQAERFLVEDTRFWVERPRVTGSSVSGLGTLLSGAFIGMDVGQSQQSSRSFDGLEVPPILTAGRPGRSFMLKSADLASISYGTPVYFRRIQVGEVIAYELDQDGQGVTATIFINAPYDRYVSAETRFWKASGVDVSLDASGFQVRTESLVALLGGGLAFADPPNMEPDEPASADSVFTLYEGRAEAFKAPDTRVVRYVFLFRESVRGLAVGAPVDFRGIVVGEVVDISVDFDIEQQRIDMRVEIDMYPDRLRSRAQLIAADIPEIDTDAWRQEWQQLVDAGLRGQLRTGNFLTGQRYVAIDFFPSARHASIDWSASPPRLPTIQGGLEGLQESLASIAGKLDRIPYEELAADVTTALDSLNQLLDGADTLLRRLDADLTPQIEQTLTQARSSLAAAERTLGSAERTLAPESPIPMETRNSLREVGRAAQSLRELADYLERHPDALLRGK